jgi:hypothetical protein
VYFECKSDARRLLNYDNPVTYMKHAMYILYHRVVIPMYINLTHVYSQSRQWTLSLYGNPAIAFIAHRRLYNPYAKTRMHVIYVVRQISNYNITSSCHLLNESHPVRFLFYVSYVCGIYKYSKVYWIIRKNMPCEYSMFVLIKIHYTQRWTGKFIYGYTH